MSTWKPGMKAVSVVDIGSWIKWDGWTLWDKAWFFCTGNRPKGKGIPNGEVVTVDGVGTHKEAKHLMLHFAEYPGDWFSAHAFRPVLLDAALLEQVEAIEEGAPVELETVEA